MDVVMVPTEFSRAIFETGGVYEDKLSVLGESVDSAFFDPERPAVREGAAKMRASIASEVEKSATAEGGASGGGGAGGASGGGGGAGGAGGESGGGVAVTDATFVLLSVFKWEERKGYKALFKVLTSREY